MSKHDWKSRQGQEERAPGVGSRRSKSPGKRTLTMTLSPRVGGTQPAPVQMKHDAAAEVARMGRDAEIESWMKVVMQPDRHGEPVQRKSAAEKRDPAPLSLPARGGGQPMPEDVQAKMEGAFGADFSAVRVHEGPQARDMGARAYTQGTDIHFAPGCYEPGSLHGQELLGHELTHVVQQSQGRVQATTQAKGAAINDDTSLEREADEMGARAARGQVAREGISEPSRSGPHTLGAAPVQRSASGRSVIQRAVDLDAWFKEENGSQIDEDKLAYLKQIQAFLADPEVGIYEGQLDFELEKRMHDFFEDHHGELSPNEAATMFLEEVLSDEEALWMNPGKEEIPVDSRQENNSDFLKRIRTGKALVDKGAATSHGEYAHRIQWFMIARFFKDKNLETYIEKVENPEGTKSPKEVEREAKTKMYEDLLELYQEMGKEEHVRRINGETGEAEKPDNIDDENLNIPLWSAILDVQGSHDRNKDKQPALEQFEGVRKAAPVNLTGDFTINPAFERYGLQIGTLGFLASPDSPISIALLDTRLKKWLQDGRKGDLALQKAIDKLGEVDKGKVESLLSEVEGKTLADGKRMEIINIILSSEELVTKKG